MLVFRLVIGLLICNSLFVYVQRVKYSSIKNITISNVSQKKTTYDRHEGIIKRHSYNNSNTLYRSIKNITISSVSQNKTTYDRLEDVIKRHSYNNSIMLMCTDSGYINMFLNTYYVCNLQQYSNLIVTCLDKLCYNKLKNMNINVALVNAETDRLVDTSAASSFGSQAFQNKVQWKLIMLLQAVNQNVRVLYIDSDIILFKDPFPVLNSYTGYDVLAQRDAAVCTGFMYLFPTLLTKQLLAKTIEMRPKMNKADDQTAFNVVVHRNPSIKLLLLPDSIFSSGAVFFKKHSYYWDRISDTQIMMHVNYVVGIKFKIYRLKELKMYKLDVNGEYSNPEAQYLTIEKWGISNNIIIYRQ